MIISRAQNNCEKGRVVVARYPLSIQLLFFLTLVGCGAKDPDYQQLLPFKGTVFDILADDFDGDGRKDVLMVSHGRDYARISYQKQPRRFGSAVDVTEVGFHPGTFLRWPGAELLYLLNGEGGNQLLSFTPKAGVGLSRLKSLPEAKPLQSAVFHWPGWGESMITIPYESDEVILFKDFNPREMRYAERIAVPLTKQRPSVREAGRALVIDDNGDGIDEIYFTVGIAGEVWKIASPEEGQPPKPTLVATIKFGIPDVVLTADFNDDGFPDLLVPDKVPTGWLHVLLNDGKGSFKEVPLPNLLPDQELQQFSIGREKDGRNTLLVVGVTTISLIQFPRQWSGGDGAELISIPRQQVEASLAALLQDLDGDGWLDAAVGLDRKTEGAWVVYGPLRDHFKQLKDQEFVLKYEKVEANADE